jgi:hypothetical protein
MAYRAQPMQLDTDRDTLVSLWTENLRDPELPVRAEQRLAWLYQQNPAGPALTWLGFDDDARRAFGCCSCYPRETWVNGARMHAAIAADFAVDRKYRIAGPAVTLQRAMARGSGEAGISFVYGWPNNQSIGVFKRVGYKVVGQTTTWAKPLRSVRHVRTALEERVPAIAGLAPLAGSLVDVGLAADDWRRLLPRLPSLRTQVLDRADERFDELLSRARPPWIMGDKTAAYLNWRYAECPTVRYRFLVVVDRHDRLQGYVVYTHVGETAVAADLFAADLGPALDHLLVGFARRAWREGAATAELTFVGTSELTRRLARLRFFPRETSRSLVLHVAPNTPPAVAAALADRERWFMLDGELDI